jgi:hypothetical protein
MAANIMVTAVIPESVTGIDEGAFSECTRLLSVVIPGSITSIGAWAFEGCTGLTSITFPDSVSSIGLGAFSGCAGLTSVHIPDSVTSIGQEAFRDCTELMKISMPSTIPSRRLVTDANYIRTELMTHKTWKDVAKYMRIPRSVKEDAVNIILTLKRGSTLPPEMILHILFQCTTGYKLLSK